tara:strand:- start:222 stop:482 length:261 start_codon:yes stop_codon:yes gene_type:complete
MRKELKYLIYVFTILAFLIFVLNYYFSDINKKNSHRSTVLYDNKIITYDEDLSMLENDTENIVDYVVSNIKKDKKKYKFWELLKDD